MTHSFLRIPVSYMNKYVYKKYLEIPCEQKEVVLSDIHIFQLDLLLTH